MAGLVQITKPAVEPITLPQAKAFLRVDIPDDDDLIEDLIMTAREECEAFIRGFLITQTWKVTLDAWPSDQSPVLIPIEPLQSVTSVTWTDDTGTVMTMNPWNNGAGDYILDTDHEPARLVLPPNQVWPGHALWPVSPIQITVKAGFGDTADSVPQAYKNGMRMCVAHWYENRPAVETSGAIPKEVPMGATSSWWRGGRYWHLK